MSSVRSYVTDAPGSVNDCNVAKVLHDGNIDLFGVPAEKFEVREKVR